MFLTLAALAIAETCPDLPSQRTPYVAQSFNATRLTGMWYEHSYIDIAQIASTCQTLNSTVAVDGSGIVTMAFRVDYGKLPFTIQEVYTPVEATTMGYYSKEAKMTGASLLKLPTVVVDVGHADNDDGNVLYTHMTLSTCAVKLGIAVREVVLATRSRVRDEALLGKMVATANSQGVDTTGLLQSNWTACPSSIAAAMPPPPLQPQNQQSSILITPSASKAALPPTGIVFIQGAEIETKSYVALAHALLETNTDFALYFYAFAFVLNVPEPLQLGSGITASIAALRKAGLPPTAPIVVIGHSLGGAMLQDWAGKNAGLVQAQVLMGSTLLRKHRDNGYAVPTMMMSGDLDGLLRVARQAESVHVYANNQSRTTTGGGWENSTIVSIIEGMSHYQFADNTTGAVPALVKAKDLRPDINYTQAHEIIAAQVASFLAVHDVRTLPSRIEGASEALLEVTLATQRLAAPLILALREEGFTHFAAACNTDSLDFPTPRCQAYPRYPGKLPHAFPEPAPKTCVCGTPWLMNASHGALEAMLGPTLVDAGVTVIATDGKHSVSDISPVHLPHIWNTAPCAEPRQGCVINTTTVTEARYAAIDGLDTGFSEVSATELRVKIVSREALWLTAGVPASQVNFTQTDVTSNPCAAINAKVIEWAVANAGAAARRRYEDTTRAQSLHAGDDVFLSNVGPLWIDNPLKLTPSKDGGSVVVHAPSSHTPVNYIIKEAAGFHYCKVLSPARAMEWIYTDSLLKKGGI